MYLVKREKYGAVEYLNGGLKGGMAEYTPKGDGDDPGRECDEVYWNTVERTHQSGA
jgi:hypothetical protein